MCDLKNIKITGKITRENIILIINLMKSKPEYIIELIRYDGLYLKYIKNISFNDTKYDDDYEVVIEDETYFIVRFGYYYFNKLSRPNHFKIDIYNTIIPFRCLTNYTYFIHINNISSNYPKMIGADTNNRLSYALSNIKKYEDKIILF